jgi:predicted PurR-regulated permease PerM
MNLNHPYTLPHWNPRQVILATFFVAAVFFGFWLLFRYHMVLVILFASMVLGTAISPLVGWFAAHGRSRLFGLAVTYTILLALFVTFLLAVMPTLVQQSLDLAVSMPVIYNDLRGMLLQSHSLILWNIGSRLPENINLIANSLPINSEPLDAVSSFVGISGMLLAGLIGLGNIFLLTTFWILERDRTQRALILLAPPGRRQQVQELWQAIESRLAAFVRGQSILLLSIGIMALIAYLIIGLPNALALALIAGVLEAVPLLGPALGAIPALLVAYSIDPVLAMWVLVSTIIIQTLENYLLVPRVMGASVGVNPILTLLVFAALGSLLGLPGALLAIPSAAVIQIFVDRFVLSKNHTNGAVPEGRGISSALRYEVQDLIGDVRKQLRKKDDRSSAGSDEIEDSIEALAVELDVLLSQEVQESTS